jgi:hypothetical protein
MSAAEVFTRGAELLRLNPPHLHDHAVLQRIERIGLVPGEPLDLRALPRVVASVLPDALARGRFELDRRLRRLGWTRNGWQTCGGTMGAWGADYLKRAAVARHFLGAAMPEDIVQSSAFVDGAGRALDGARAYRLRFEPDEQPPVHSLWSLTVYDEHGYAVPNAIGKYVLGSQNALTRGRDGSLELVIQRDPPGTDPPANWLPCPPGTFNACLRLYRPEREAFDNAWAPPPLRRSGTRADLEVTTGVPPTRNPSTAAESRRV